MVARQSFPPAQYIADADALQVLANELLREPLVAIDTESNSMHAYHSRVCLIQVSTRARDYIIDPLALKDLRPLAPVFQSETVEKVFHAAEYDLICLKREFDFEVVNLFDTMYAARVLGATSVGLADLLREHYGIEMDKSHQLDDWARRPLEADALHYAQMDTHYLPDLRDQLVGRLAMRGQMDEAREVFEDVSHIESPEKDFDTEGYWKIGLPAALNPRQLAVLREVYVLRDHIAREEDLPHYKVISNKTLVEVAMRMPRNHQELAAVRGISGRMARERGGELLRAIERGRTARPPQPPAPERQDPDLTERYIRLHAWRKERAMARGVESNIIISKNTLWALARQMPKDLQALAQIPGMGAWRLGAYGEEILEVIESLRLQQS